MFGNVKYFNGHSREGYEYVTSATENYCLGSEYVGHNRLRIGAKENYYVVALLPRKAYIYIIVNANKENAMLNKKAISKKQKGKLAKFTTTSAKIRYLTAQGFKRPEIAKALGIRYQWVRNVQITPLKRN